MKKKHFKRGMLILVGLAGFFLTISVVLVASAGISGGSGSGASAGGLPHRERPVTQAANVRFQGKSPDRKSGVDVSGSGGGEADPCLPSPTACIDAGNQGGDGTAGNWQNAGDSGVTGGKGSSPGDRSAFYPSSYGANFFGADGAVPGQFAGTGENGGSSQGGGVAGALPGIAEPDPETTSFPNDPIATPSPLSPLFPTVPSNPGDPTGPPDNTPTDPPPPGAAPPYAVPEPSTFWLLIVSLTVIVLGHGHVRRDRQRSRMAQACQKRPLPI
jgi:hypothetical protein